MLNRCLSRVRKSTHSLAQTRHLADPARGGEGVSHAGIVSSPVVCLGVRRTSRTKRSQTRPTWVVEIPVHHQIDGRGPRVHEIPAFGKVWSEDGFGAPLRMAGYEIWPGRMKPVLQSWKTCSNISQRAWGLNLSHPKMAQHLLTNPCFCSTLNGFSHQFPPLQVTPDPASEGIGALCRASKKNR